MKDLDKTQVYDLIGITEEQAKELYAWLLVNEEGWDDWGYENLIGDDGLEYFHTEWGISSSKPTTHISALFEPTYEEQLQEAKKKLDHYKKEVERLENESKPKINDVCKFWNYFESDFVIGILTDTDESSCPYQAGGYAWYEHAKKVTEQEVIDLLFNK